MAFGMMEDTIKNLSCITKQTEMNTEMYKLIILNTQLKLAYCNSYAAWTKRVNIISKCPQKQNVHTHAHTYNYMHTYI